MTAIGLGVVVGALALGRPTLRRRRPARSSPASASPPRSPVLLLGVPALRAVLRARRLPRAVHADPRLPHRPGRVRRVRRGSRIAGEPGGQPKLWPRTPPRRTPSSAGRWWCWWSRWSGGCAATLRGARRWPRSALLFARPLAGPGDPASTAGTPASRRPGRRWRTCRSCTRWCPTRWALAITPIIGVLLALGAHAARELAARHPARPAADPLRHRHRAGDGAAADRCPPRCP